MKKTLVFLALLFVAGLLAGKVLLGSPSLEAKAQAAYDAKDYPKAFDIYKQYAESLRDDKPRHDAVIMKMVQIQNLILESQAQAAYDAKDYPKAAKLYKQLADAQAGDKGRQAVILRKLTEIQNLIPPATVAAGQSPAATTTQSADMMSQAMSYALQNNGTPGDPPMSAADRIPHTKPKYGDVLTMTIKEMANFEFDPATDSDVPADIKLLEGAHVKLNGYMIPLTQAIKVDKFALVPSLSGCCFGAPPGVQHIVTCTTPKDRAMDYVLDELEIDGVVHVHVMREDGYTSSIFELDVTGAKIKE